MAGKLRTHPRAVAVGLVLVGMVFGGLMISPAGAHFLPKLQHLRQHLDRYFLTESEGNNNYLGEQAKAADSDLLDGLDSSAFVTSTTGKAADADKLDGLNSTDFLRSTGKAADADKLDNLDSAAFVQGASVVGRSFSCPGSSFYPVDGDQVTAYETDGEGLRYFDTGTGALRCHAALPNAATVTGVTYTVFDNDAANVSCRLLRTDLTTPVTAEDNVAAPVSSSGTPGETTITAATLTNTTIANASFAYSLECTLNSTDINNGVFGAVVNYTITAANG